MLSQYCLTKRCLVMTGGLTLSSVLVLYGIFGCVYSSVIKTEYKSNNVENKELRLVHVVFRHGPRTPADTYPNDPYLNEIFFPVGWGQLTNEGKMFLYNTGKWLRKRYDNFLGSIYQPEIVHAQATGVPRTHMSLALVLAGLWPPKNTPTEWSTDLNWQPIPIYSEPLDKDTLLLVRTSCPRYHEALDEVFELPEVKSLLTESNSMFKELTKITGLNISTPDDVQSLYSTLRAEDEFGLKLPAWTKLYYPEKLKYITELSYIYNVYTEELKRIKGGPFVKKMIEEWESVQENALKQNPKKIYLYTGHDSTISNILSALNVWDQQFPVYGIMSIFELYKDLNTGDFEVQMYLRNDTHKDPYPLTIPGCEFSCPLKKFQNLTSAIIPQDVKKECSANDSSFTEPPLGGP